LCAYIDTELLKQLHTATPACLSLPCAPQEHLVLVTELLRANLYEFSRYNRESGDEPYFTLPRIQSIARQVRGLRGV
jgi:hypothetical protein